MKNSECTLSKETQDLLYRYFAAAANLYGIIEIGKLLKIYNSQNEPLSKENFLSFVENMNFKVNVINDRLKSLAPCTR